jgi:hypothetical protein
LASNRVDFKKIILSSDLTASSSVHGKEPA